MKCKVSNWMVLTINNSRELVTRGVDVSKKFFSTYKDAREYMIEESNKYAKAKERDLDKNEAFIDCGEYFVQICIIDCSKEIEILGIEWLIYRR